ncbi:MULTISPECIES: hypothetical protein [unclassified Streptomyces]|uniref:hypothetical protein n=1 Tax=unclassified Streptomyces TaxID=2593676 RepID=UPI001F3ABBCE|nr:MULTISPECIES: hypothetical protein [unclassified Streptomyces]MCF0086596.1 hypothetical protein [Streptomyces sp. MH192]MCF0098750.1 hypothetical protein [Streptomyces sp. MH191]
MPRWRYFAQHALTGEILHPALPLSEVEFGNELNGPGSFTATIAPKWAQANEDLLSPPSTLIYAEADGFLRWGGLVWDTTPTEGRYPIEAAGWSSYLTKRFDQHGELNGRGPYVNQDPCVIIRHLWAYAQEQPDGNLGVVVDATNSNAKVGTPAEPWHSYYYETPALGDHLDDLVSEAGSPQYTNACSWQANGSIERRLRLGYPRLGTRRTDISFSTGVNVIDSPPVKRSGDEYANTVIGTGSGEGTAIRFAVDSVRDGNLRMEYVLALPTVNGTDTLGRRVRAERIRRQKLGQIEQITLRDHPAAPLGSWQIGDDVYASIHNQWGSYTGWVRVTADSYKPSDSPDRAVLTVARADSFHYGSAEVV